MEDYKGMYYILFNKITDMIGELQAVQEKTEELLISQEPKQVVSTDIQNQKVKNCLFLRDSSGSKIL